MIGGKVTRLVTEDGLNISARLAGRGALTCVLVHGTGDGAYIWEEFSDSVESFCQTLAIDLRGHGDSDWSPSGDYRIEAYTLDVLTLIKTQIAGKFILIGHSLGGDIAIRVAASSPSDMVGLVLVDSGPSVDQESAKAILAKMKEGMRVFATTSEYRQWLEEARPFTPPIILDRLSRAALTAAANGVVPKVDPAIFAELPDTIKLSSNFDERSEWQRLELVQRPSLILRGVASSILRRSVAEQMIRRLPNGRLRTVKGAGHAVMTDSPSEFARIVATFIREIYSLSSPALL
jgi:3-oxoadipate enol-lactonase